MMRLVLPLVATVLLLTSRASTADDSAGFHWVDHPEQGTCDLLYNGKPALRYMYAFDKSTPKRVVETFKVFHHVFGPGTDDLITNGPGGLFPHHRGMFVGWRQTQFDGGEIDSWHCTKGVNQRHIRFVEQKADADSAKMTAEISWNDGKGKPVVNELRSVSVAPFHFTGGAPGWDIRWSSELRSRRGKVVLTGDRQHAGFQFRAAQSVADSKSATFMRPQGFPQDPKAFEVDDRKNPNSLINLGWFAMTFPINGKQYTVTYFDDPAAPKPSYYSERPYGRFGTYFKTTLQPDVALKMNYRLLVSPGDPPTREAIESLYAPWVAARNAASAQNSK